jgi:hypothetical protein
MDMCFIKREEMFTVLHRAKEELGSDTSASSQQTRRTHAENPGSDPHLTGAFD